MNSISTISIEDQARHVTTMMTRVLQGINYTNISVGIYTDAPMVVVFGDGCSIGKFVVCGEDWLPVRIFGTENGWAKRKDPWGFFLPEGRLKVPYYEIHKCMVAYLENPQEAEARIKATSHLHTEETVRPWHHNAFDYAVMRQDFVTLRAEETKEQEPDFHTTRNWVVGVKHGILPGQSMYCIEARTKKAQRFTDRFPQKVNYHSPYLTAKGKAEKLEERLKSFR